MQRPPNKHKKRPYNSPKREAARAATRAKIVTAASHVLREHGWEGFSVEAVAREARVTRLTVYHQFGERRALLEAVFDAEAERGGIVRLPDVLALPDPERALRGVIAIFCTFWAKRGSLQAVVAAAMADSELGAALHARNERRRQLLSVLVSRMVERKQVGATAADALVDTLFALTSFAFYAELASGRHLSAEQARAVIESLAKAALRERFAEDSAS